jgi:tetratricopeptide (TPR) repeat protein
MQTEEIIGLMRGKAPYTDKTLSQLADVIEEYPYFQAAHLLHTLNLLQLKDTHFPSELRKTSAHLNDRRKLFFRVEDKSFPPEIIEVLEKTDEKSTVSTFDRIDFFLSGKEMTEETKDAPPVSSDYISYFLSKENKGEEKRESQPLQNQDAIERFLEKDKISPVKINLKDKETEKEDYISNLDTVDEDSFFSETLAKIYLKQKKYDKALEIIRKLNLIYPEKSRYFADQIRFLEKLIINTNKIK